MLHLICCIWAMVLFFFFRQQYFYFSIFGAIISCCRTLDGIPLENCPKNHSQKKQKKRMKNVCQINWMWIFFVHFTIFSILCTIRTTKHAPDHSRSHLILVQARIVHSEVFEFVVCFRNTSHFACLTTLFWLNFAYIYLRTESGEINHDMKINNGQPAQWIITNNIVFICDLQLVEKKWREIIKK